MGKVEFFRSSFGEFSESNSIVFFIEHDIYLMAVTFVMRRQLHIVAIDNTAMLNGVGRTLKEVALKHDVLVRNHDSPRETLIEPGTLIVLFINYM